MVIVVLDHATIQTEIEVPCCREMAGEGSGGVADVKAKGLWKRVADGRVKIEARAATTR